MELFTNKKESFSEMKRKLLSFDEYEQIAKTPKNLKGHKEEKYEKLTYPCDLCDYITTTSGDLKKHKQSKHEGIRYPCDQCDYMATQSGHLKTHKKFKHK